MYKIYQKINPFTKLLIVENLTYKEIIKLWKSKEYKEYFEIEVQ